MTLEMKQDLEVAKSIAVNSEALMQILLLPFVDPDKFENIDHLFESLLERFWDASPYKHPIVAESDRVLITGAFGKKEYVYYKDLLDAILCAMDDR
jgi:hypothetical protein